MTIPQAALVTGCGVVMMVSPVASNAVHDDVMTRKHSLHNWLTLCEGNPLVAGGFPSYSANKAELQVFFVLCNKLLHKQLNSRWIETPCAHVTGLQCMLIMMTSSNGNIVCITGPLCWKFTGHRAMASQITSLTIVYSAVYSGANQRKQIKVPRHWPLCGEFTGNRGISRTKDQ